MADLTTDDLKALLQKHISNQSNFYRAVADHCYPAPEKNAAVEGEDVDVPVATTTPSKRKRSSRRSE